MSGMCICGAAMNSEECRLRGHIRGPHPVYDEPVHACPPVGSGIMPCCGRTPFEVPCSDRMTSTETVTCQGASNHA